MKRKWRRKPADELFLQALVEAEHQGIQLGSCDKFGDDQFAWCESCAKRIYESSGKASAAIASLESHGKANAKNRRIHTYRCPINNGYHVGRTHAHTTRRRR